MAISEEAKKRLLEAKQTVTNPTEQQSGFSASTQERLQAYKEWGAPILQQRDDARRAGYEERKALGIDFTAGDSESGKAKYEAAKAGKIAAPQSSEQQSTFWDVLDSDTAPNLAPDASLGAKIAKGLWQFGHYSAGGNADTSLPTGLQTDVVQAKQNDPERTLEIGRLSDNDRNEFYRQYDIDPEYAEEWAKKKIAETKANEAESMKAWAEEHPLWGNVASLAPLGATGADIMDVITDVYAGANHYDPFDPLTPTGISQTMREGAKAGSWFGQSGVGQFVDDVLYSSLQSQWSNVVGGGAFEGTGMSSLPLAFYSASAEARSLLQQGYDKREASILATGYGIISFITEAIGSDRIFDKAFKNTAMGEGFKQFGRRLGSIMLKSMLSEGTEEGAEDIADWVLEGIVSIINGTDHRTFSEHKANRLEEGNSDSKATALAIWDMFLEFNEDVLAGALSGGLMAGTTATLAQTGELARNTTSAYKYDKKGAKGDLVSNIKSIAEASGSDYANNIQATDSKFLKKFAENLKIGEAMSRANRDIYVGAIQDRLEQLGIPLEESRAKAEAIYRNAMGGTLSSKEKTLVNDELSKRVLGEIDDRAGWVYNAYATMSRVSDADTPKLTPEGAVAKMQMEQDKVREAYNSLKPLSEEDYLSLAQKYKDEQAISTNAKPPMQGGTNPMDIRSNSSERASQYGAQLLGGVRLANEGDREISEEDMWNSLSPNVGIGTESLAAAFAKRKEEVSLNRYANAVDLAYNYGKAGMKLADVVRNIGFSMDSALSEAYNNGQESYVKGLQNNKLRIDRKTANVSYISNEEASKMGVDAVDIASLSDDQNAYIDALDTISKAYGVKMVLFESSGNTKIENGHYDPTTNSIYIDVSSVSGLRKYAMLSTASHELVHDFRRVTPEVFDALRQFVIDKYYGGSETKFNEAVKRIMQQRKLQGFELASPDDAVEELVAMSCEKVFDDPNMISRLAETLESKSTPDGETLLDKVIKWFDDLIKRLKSALAKLTGIKANKYAEEMSTKDLEHIRDLFVQAAKEIQSTDDGGLSESGIEYDAATDTAMMSTKDIPQNEEEITLAVERLSKKLGVTKAEAREWVESELSAASLILDPKFSDVLDYRGDRRYTAIKKNSDYPQGTLDFSNICRKRRNYTAMMQRLQKRYPNRVFTAEELAEIRQILIDNDIQVACGLCFVEDRRQNETGIAKTFQDAMTSWFAGERDSFNKNQTKALQMLKGEEEIPSIYELTTLEGMQELRAKAPNVADAWEKFNNARGMQSARLLQGEAEYKRQILKYNAARVKRINDLGGLRIFSFSDFEEFHLIDIIQAIQDCAAMGLKIQGYTKVPSFAKLVMDTGTKVNRSLIPKGDLGYRIENGKTVLEYDTTEGIDINDPDFFDSTDNPNIGNILVGINDEQIAAAFLDPFVDYIIPFHTGQRADVLRIKKIGAWKNYKDYQEDKPLPGTTRKKGINIYTEVLDAAEKEGKPITNERQFVEKFLEVCKREGMRPRFSQFLNTDENGNYVYRKGYYKVLLDFKLFDKDGNILPQNPVKPIFDNEYINSILTRYAETKATEEKGLAPKMERAYDEIENKLMHSFKGDSLSLGNRRELNIAKKMEEKGKDSESIRLATGWFKGMDGRWRYEIDDSDAKLNTDLVMPNGFIHARTYYDAEWERLPLRIARLERNIKEITQKYGKDDSRLINQRNALRETKNRQKAIRDAKYRFNQNNFLLTDILAHPALYKAYPQLKNVTVHFSPKSKDGAVGWASGAPKSNTAEITLALDRANADEILSTLMHEVQHIIQNEEGFARGSNIEYEKDLLTTAAKTKAADWMNAARDAENEAIAKEREYIQEHFPKQVQIRRLYGGDYEGLAKLIRNYTSVMLYAPEADYQSEADGILEAAKKYKRFDQKIFDDIQAAALDFRRNMKQADSIINNVSDEEARARYYRSAGETESRDVQERINLTEEGRKQYRPDIDKTDRIVRFSTKDSEGNDLSENQQKYFADSVIRDKDGNLLLMHHGTSADFTEFDRKFIGQTGRFEGAGFNFTPSYGRASSYSNKGKVLSGYLNITKPLSATQKTMSVRQLANLIAEIDPTGDNIIVNYAQNSNDYPSKAFVRRESLYTARQIWDYAENDVDIYSEISTASPDSDSIIEKFQSMGYDGAVHYDDNGKLVTAIAFDSNQFKLQTNTNPTNNRDIRYSTKEIDTPPLKTLNNSVIRRSNYGVGKDMGGQIYVHKNYADEIVPSNVWDKAVKLLPDDFSYNTVMYDKKKPSVVRFDEAPDFDTAREPHPGKMLYVDTANGTVKPATGNPNFIWHHKWQWVKNDYEGFDVQESYNWSKEWLKKITNPSGSLKVWNETLEKNGLPLDKKFSTKQEITSEDTSLNQTPSTFTNFQFSSNDRVLDWGGGRYDAAKTAMETVYPGIAFEVYDPFNRTESHNQRVLDEFKDKPATKLTINNVLNVIKEESVREDVLRESKQYLADDGVAYILIHPGTPEQQRAGGGVTTKGWQNAKQPSWYLPSVRKFYKNVRIVGSTILASDGPIEYAKMDATTKAKMDVAKVEAKAQRLDMKNSKFSFKGTSALDADLDTVNVAEEMEANGYTSEQVRQATGWFKGYDGKWRYEVDDSKAKMVDLERKFGEIDSIAKALDEGEYYRIQKFPIHTTLGEILIHPNLYKAYPYLKNTPVIIQDGFSNYGIFSQKAAASTDGETITFNYGAANESPLSIIMHEIQHMIQTKEGFAKGSSPSTFRSPFYVDNLEGVKEAKARYRTLLNQFKNMSAMALSNARMYEYYNKQKRTDKGLTLQYDLNMIRDVEAVAEKGGYLDLLKDFLAAAQDLEVARAEAADKIDPMDMYMRTAGEIEARDVQARLDLPEWARKNIRPDIDRTDTIKLSTKDDAEYLELAKNPEKNKAELEKMVRDAAYAAGYRSPMLYHGTNSFGFTTVNLKKSDDRISFFATNREDTAATYGKSKKVTPINSVQYIDESELKTREGFWRGDRDVLKHLDRLGIEYTVSKPYEGRDTEYVRVPAWDSSFNDGKHDYSIKWANDISQVSYELSKRYSSGKTGIYQLYGNTNNFLEIDGNGANWNQIELGKIEDDFNDIMNTKRPSIRATTRQIVKYAKAAGYSGVLFKNIRDSGWEDGYRGSSDVYAFFHPNQVKSADPVTYDSNGNVIPLSERFNPKNKDIRYSTKDSEYMELAQNPERNETELRSMLNKAAAEAGYTGRAYHGTYAFGRTSFDLYNALFLTDSVDVARNFSGGQPSRTIAKRFNPKTARLTSLIKYANENTYASDIRGAVREDIEEEIERVKVTKTDIERIKKYYPSTWEEEFEQRKVWETAAREKLKAYDEGKIFLYMPFNSIANDYPNDPLFDRETLENFVAKYAARTEGNGGVYDIYFKKDHMVSIDVRGAYYTDVPIPEKLMPYATAEEKERGLATSDQILRMAIAAGYQTVEYRNMREGGDYGNAGVSNVYAVVDSAHRVKSADLVTYDDDGNIIPLSERFNESNNDIRYSLKEDLSPNEYLASAVLDNIRKPEDRAGLAEYLNRHKELYQETTKLSNEITDLENKLHDSTVLSDSDRESIENRIKTLRKDVRENEKKMWEIVSKPRMQRIIEQQRATIQEYEEEMAKAEEKSDKKIAELRARMDTNVRAEIDKRIAMRKRMLEQQRTQKSRYYYLPRIEKVSKELRKNLEKAPMPFRGPIADFLAALDTRTLDAQGNIKDNKANARKTNLIAALNNMSRIAGTTEEWLNKYNVDFNPEMVTWIDEMVEYLSSNRRLLDYYGDINLNTLSADMLEGVYKMVRSLNTTLKNLTKSYTNKALDISEEAKAVMEFDGKLSHGAADANMAEKIFRWKNAQATTVYQRMGDGGWKMYKLLVKGQSKLAFNEQQIVDFAKSHWRPSDVRNWNKPKNAVAVEISGEKVMMTPAQMMALYATSRDADGLRHLLEGGGFKLLKQSSGNKMVVDVARHMTEMDLANVINALNEYDPKLIKLTEEIQDFIGQVGAEWGNEVSVARFGYEQFGIENYFPLHTVAADKVGTVTRDDADAGKFWSMLNRSFTKERTFKANNALVIDGIFDIFATHMSQMALYNAYALPVLDTARFMNWEVNESVGGKPKVTTLGEVWDKAFGKGEMRNYLTNLLDSIAGAKRMDAFEAFALAGLRLHNRVAVAANFRVAAQQPFSITRAFDELGPKYFAKVPKNIKALQEEMWKNSGIALWKHQGNYDTNIKGSLTSQVMGAETGFGQFKDDLSEKAMWLAEKGDDFTWALIWNACKAYVSETQPTLTDKAYMDAVVSKFEDVVLLTQVVDTPLQKSEWMREKSFWFKMTSSFKAEPTTSYNMLLRTFDRLSEAKQSGKTGAAWAVVKGPMLRAFATYALTSLVNAMVTAVIDAARDDDDYETLLEKLKFAFIGDYRGKNFGQWITEFMGSNVGDSINPIKSLPWFADAFSLIEGYDADRADLTILEEILTQGKAIWTAFTKGDMSYKKVFKLADALSKVIGIPFANVMRDVTAVWNTVFGRIDSTVKLQISPESKQSGYNAFYYAIQSGETVKAMQIVDEIYSNEISSKTAYTGVTNVIRKAYQDGKIDKEDALDYMLMTNDYFKRGFDRAHIKNQVDGWSQE